MQYLSRRLIWLSAALAGTLAQAAPAQCLEWDSGFAGTGIGGSVNTTLQFDDGSGEAVYVGGDFNWVSGTRVADTARWDGTSWSAMGSEIAGKVIALASYDDGSGPALYAGGAFVLSQVVNTNLAVWNGSAWVAAVPPLGGNEVSALRVFDDGSGAALYIAVNASTNGLGKVFEWDGVTLTEVGSMTRHVEALEVYDNGGGARLYAAVKPGGSTWHLVEWQGGATWTNWEFVQGAGSLPLELCVLDTGSGPQLHVAGDFSSVGGVPASRVAALGAFNWSGMGPGVNGTVNTLLSHDDGLGSALYAGGGFTSSGGTTLKNIASFDGASWSGLGTPDGVVRDLGEDLDGALLVGGDFVHVNGELFNRLARWKNLTWGPLGVGHGFDDDVQVFAVFDDGSGPALYAGGSFVFAGVDKVHHIARWSGSGWEALAGGVDDVVYAMKVLDDGTGDALYVGGDFLNADGMPATRIARWDGASWQSMGAGVNGIVTDFDLFDTGSGPEVYVGGEFSGRIRRWSGTNWKTLPVFPLQTVNDLVVWDDGSGEALYVCGPIVQIGALTAKGVARWDGTTWTALGAGLGPNNREVHELGVFDDGNGERLYAGGNFTTSGGTPVSRIAKWTGSAWVQVGTGTLNAQVRTMTSFDDGTGGGPALYVGGDFSQIGGVNIDHLARWDGAAWSAVGTVVSHRVNALASFDDGIGKGPSLWVGGDFFETGNVQSSHVARYSNPCPQVGVNYCTAGTSASGCQAIMSASGMPSATAPTGFFFHVGGLEGQKTGLFLWASNGKQSNSWGSGTSYICVVPPRYRSAVLGSSGTIGQCDGNESTDMNARWTLRPNSNPGPGAVTLAQFWYRDPQNTSNQTSSLSDGLEFLVGP